jgi:hypothetical protein
MVDLPARRPAGDMSYQRNYAARIVVLGAVVQRLLADHFAGLTPEQHKAFAEGIAHDIGALIDELTASGPVPAAFQKSLNDLKDHAPAIAADFIKGALGGDGK